MNLESQVTLLTIRNQPNIIFDRLLHNEDLLKVVDLVASEYPGLGIFDHHELVEALEKIHTDGGPVHVRTKGGKKCRLDRLSEGINVTPDEDEHAGRIVSEFAFLYPLPAIRLNALNEILADSRPWFPSAEYWHSVLEVRSLSETELNQLVNEINSTPTYFWATLQEKWRSGNITAQDLVPSSRFYYQSLIGPLPEGHNVDAYLHDVFKLHIRKIVGNNKNDGLEFCLSAYLRDDMSPSSFFEGLDDQEVLDLVSNFLHQDNPFVLLGILDIVVKRKSGNARLEALASDLIQRLITQTLSSKDNFYYYELMPPLARLCYRLISNESTLYDTPPYWRWLAAFVHTHFLINILGASSLDVTSFSSWCDRNVTSKMTTKQLIDMQQEPMWTGESLTSVTLRAEIVGRLLNLGASIQHQGGTVTFLDRLQEEVMRLKEDAPPIFSIFCPGPLEGHLRKKNTSNAHSTEASDVADIFHQIVSDLEVTPAGDAWLKLVAFTRIFLFDPELLKRIESVTRRLGFDDDDENHQSFFNAVAGAAFIAATQPYEPLAEAVAETITREASKLKTGTDTESGYRLLLIAAAAFSDRTTWLDWLDQKITDYAYSLPKGIPCAQLHESLKELMSLFPVKEWCFGRATKVAAAALR